MPSRKTIHLSVILPVLDAEDDIEALFNSLKNQTGIDKKTIEIVIVNDGSTDTTASSIKDFSPLLKDFREIHVVTHKIRQGLAVTRVDGANKATGKFITFIDKKGRPDNDYLAAFINKKRNIVIGNPYIDKRRNLWGRVLALIRKKLYFPYFNHPFDDIDLDYEKYLKFKNKGGGGSMYVLRTYYQDAVKTMPLGVHVNDDSQLVSKLAQIEPVLKTSSAKLEYLNRGGFLENIAHLYNRGPKFVDFYAKPGTRFFLPIISLVVWLIINIILCFINPTILAYEGVVLAVALFIVAIYVSESWLDFFASILIIPIAVTSFSVGVIRGLALKLLGKY